MKAFINNILYDIINALQKHYEFNDWWDNLDEEIRNQIVIELENVLLNNKMINF